MELKLKDQLKRKAKDFETVMFSYLPEEKGRQEKLFEAMNYSIKAGGKRLRPIFLLETYRMLCTEKEKQSGEEFEKKLVIPFAMALEMIHTYSLVHDDLPAMDNDQYRRGKLTTHAAYGEGTGILAGDALLNFAFEQIAKVFVNIEEFPAEQRVALYQRASKAFQILSEKSGAFGMVGGQFVDVLETGKPLDAQTLLFIYELKTAALLQVAMMVGAVLAGAEELVLLQIEKISLHVGLSFQIQDDILDIVSTNEVLGKPVRSDMKNKKTTYVTLFGMEEAVAAVERYSKQALQIFDQLPQTGEFLRELIISLITRNA